VFYDRNQYTERSDLVAQRRTMNTFGLEGSACCFIVPEMELCEMKKRLMKEYQIYR
jgi:hypothetical protein